MKADYVHKDTRTIVVDGVEIQTSLSAVEIADLYQKNQELKKENEKNKHYKTLYQSLKKQKDELKEDISFCLKSIKQEMEMSKDSRTRGEMKSCYEILERCNK